MAGEDNRDNMGCSQDGGTHGVAGELRTARTTWNAVKMAAHMEWLESCWRGPVLHKRA